MFVVLPDKEVTVDRGPPYAGSSFFYSGSGDNLDNVMYKQFNLRTSEREMCTSRASTTARSLRGKMGQATTLRA